MNEFQKSRGCINTKCRSISFMEMWKFMLGYPHIHKYMVFYNKTSLPLEQIEGLLCKPNGDNFGYISQDGHNLLPLRYEVRQDKCFLI